MIQLAASLYKVIHDEDGESRVQFRVPASDLAACVGLAALHNTLLRPTVEVETAAPAERVTDRPTLAQYALSEHLVTRLGWTELDWRPRLLAFCGVEHRSKLTRGQMSMWLSELERHVQETKGDTP